jgi:hypothetical protein
MNNPTEIPKQRILDMSKMQQELPDQPQEKHHRIQQQQQRQRHQQEKLTKIDLANLEQSVKKAASFGLSSAYR